MRAIRSFGICIFTLLLGLLVPSTRVFGRILNFSHTKLPGTRAARVLYQDRLGYIWIGSEGLVRYDGASFTSYEHEARNPSSLTCDEVVSIVQGDQNALWIGTSQGISRLDIEKGSFTNYLPGTKGPRSVNDSYNSLWKDKTGTIWAGNYAGLSRYDDAKDRFVPYALNIPGDDPGDQFVLRIENDPAHTGCILLARRHSIISLDLKTGKTERYAAPKEVFLTNLYVDHQGHIWACSWGRGLGQFDEKTGQFRFFRFEADNTLGTSNVVVDIVQQENQSGSAYYVATAGGLTTLKLDGNEWNGDYARPFQTYDPADSRTPGYGIADLLVDRQNILWLATSHDLSYLPPNNRIFSTIARKSLGTLYAVQHRHGNGWWLGSWYANDIMLATEDLGTIELTGFLKDVPDPDDRQVSAILEDIGSHTLWAGTFGGLFSIDLKTGKRRAWPAISKNSRDTVGLPSNHIISLACLPGRKLWIGTYSRGAALLDAESGKYIPLPRDLGRSLSNRRINLIYVDKQGRSWLGAGWSIIKINPDWTWKEYSNTVGRLRTKAEGDVTCFAEDSAGHLWIGSQAGLNRYCPATDDFDLFTTAEGLSSNKIQNLVTDRQGRLWIGTENGLTAFTLGAPVQQYYVHNGLYSNNTFNSMTLTGRGEVLIGGTDFLTRFDPKHLVPNREAPPVYLTGIKLINYPEKKIIPSRIDANGLKLNYDENYLSIDFIALNLINPDQNRYQYRMANLDKGWVQAGPERRATYSNLAPGTYRFQVRAANSDGIWNNEGASIIITVRPPFWQTWWFRGMCMIAIGVVLYAIYRYRLRQALALERIRADISAGLHDEIGSTLSSISILSGMTSATARPEFITSAMGTINQSSRGLMEQMNDIVWSINPRYDSLDSLFQRIGQFAAHVLEPQDIDFDMELPGQLPGGRLAVQTRQNLYLLIKEAINNIAKHSSATKATLKVQLSAQHLTIELTDNGKGYDPYTADGGNGLHNMTNRANTIKAKLKITTGIGAGTHLQLKLRWNRYAIDPTRTLA